VQLAGVADRVDELDAGLEVLRDLGAIQRDALDVRAALVVLVRSDADQGRDGVAQVPPEFLAAQVHAPLERRLLRFDLVGEQLEPEQVAHARTQFQLVHRTAEEILGARGKAPHARFVIIERGNHDHGIPRVASSAFSRATVSKPSIPGILTSSRIRSGFLAAASARPLRRSPPGAARASARATAAPAAGG